MAEAQKRLNLARKYRPRSLDQLTGQQSVVQMVQEALKSDRIAPAYLLSGPRGVGKTSLARILARAASCTSKELSKRPCETCDACLASLQGKNMDILEIDGASHTGVDDVRRIIDAVAYRPSIGKRSIYIVDEVHMLSNAAFNALLKTLEEPPAHALFLFATTEPEKLPSTILSRVQRLELRRLPENIIFENLKAISEKEKIKVTEKVLHQITAAADGALRDAQTLLEQMLLLSANEKIDEQVVDSFLGTIGSEQEIALLRNISTQDTASMLKQIQNFYEKGKDLIKLNQRLVLWMRGLLIVKSTQQMDLVSDELPKEYLEQLLEAYSKWSLEDCDRLFELLWKSYERIKNSEMPKVTLETSLIRSTRIAKTTDIHKLMQKLAEMPTQQRPAPVQNHFSNQDDPRQNPSFDSAPDHFKTTSQPAARQESFKKKIEKRKFESAEDVVSALKQSRPSLWALVKCAQQKELTGSTFRLCFTKQHFGLKQLSEPLMKKELVKALTDLSGPALTLELVELSEADTEKPGKRTDFIKEAKEQILLDPEIQKAASILKGKISSVTVEGIKT